MRGRQRLSIRNQIAVSTKLDLLRTTTVASGAGAVPLSSSTRLASLSVLPALKVWRDLKVSEFSSTTSFTCFFCGALVVCIPGMLTFHFFAYLDSVAMIW